MKHFFHLALFFILPAAATAQTELHGHIRSSFDSSGVADVEVIVFLDDSFAYTTSTDSLGNFTFHFPQPETKFRFLVTSSIAPVAVTDTSFAPLLASFPKEQSCTLTVLTLPPFIDDRGGPPAYGIFHEYYKGGRLYMYRMMARGEPAGMSFCFYESGQLWSRGTFVNGVREGYGVSFHQNGKKSSEGYYKNGKMTGKWKFWDEEGTMVEKDFSGQ